MRKLLLITFLFSVHFGFTQTDFLVLKKKDRTIQTFMPGSVITFQLDNHQWLQGIIKKIARDSVFIREVKINPVYGAWGFAGYDTGILNIIKFHFKSMIAFPAKKRPFAFITNGLFFQIGSASYAGLNIINGIARKEKIFDNKNSMRLGIAAIIFGIGEYLHLSHPPDMRLGKKYRLLYIRAAG